MANKTDAYNSELAAANDQSRYQITASDLPLSCPLPNMQTWNSHPRVFLPLDENGEAHCPYCGARYILS